MFEGPVTDNMDVFEAILAAKNGGGFNILYHANSNKEPVAISSIDEIESDPFGKKWYVYINNNLIEQGFDALSLLIETGDLIVLKYE
ncbi:MAG: hypothetical protein COV29_04000 [Candidatus Yanofskybacteria bacterium CG10_big_fil_rev_8_21_14_0_10_36_16]|uniref:DUF4430 domain-containing protein n=1 Tax=Candidatus Yanofskybacteria bacterium CG10_big_fil_rev_8_21_14_0_10_36_16 TaxID=1975096 RepID=A0A2J0Q6P7_9BACT|nr:MAG: hypothetical protein COV29_04000 [Candidatus Yanofskybacteria bacterium CG10_big_fil_rev_8_21_14_0_10_36_16]